MNSNIKVIFFDVGNTLLFPNRERIHAPLAQRGFTPDAEHLRDLECRTKNRFDAMMTKTAAPTTAFGGCSTPGYYSRSDLKTKHSATSSLPASRIPANWDLIRPGTAEQLREIGERYRIAVISNADGGIKDVLHRCGIAGCFRTITDSGLVGYEKPHPEIFRQALKSMNAAPGESLYVGDVYSVDYLGATGAGLQAVLMDVPGAYRAKGVPRVESLKELQTLLRDRESTAS